MKQIQMVDLVGQYEKIKEEVNQAIHDVIASSSFINGPQVRLLEEDLQKFNQVNYAICCGNGTDALQISMMALGLKPGDEIIVPAFTYVATVEAAALLGLKPVLAEVDPDTFNLDPEQIEKLITSRTKAIIPVHLFGQCADMELILSVAQQYNLFVIEDAAQAIGANYSFSNGAVKRAGTIGSVGTTSFFPSKNLGCYGDGGAIFSNDEPLARTIRMIANHGQQKKYYHDIIGVNSRLDTIQAAILRVKLQRLNAYIDARQQAALFYDDQFKNNEFIITPKRNNKSSHVYHQYTLKVKGGNRDKMINYLQERKIPTMVYYPLPIHFQKAYQYLGYKKGDLPVSEALCDSVISLPIHTELEEEQLNYITQTVNNFFN